LSEPAVRPARATDAELVAPLLYESAADMYDRFAGGRERAVRLLKRALATPGSTAAAEVVSLAELDGREVGAIAMFPVIEALPRARVFLRLTLRSIPPWRWPAALWLYRAGARAAPPPPDATLYVDALAVERSARRRGVASALLAHAEIEARRRGLPAIALDTALDNRAARALYLGAGYEEVAYRAPGRGLPGFVALVKPLS
jgi:ribosomal protein S18 acetylase RimI-like enzyme